MIDVCSEELIALKDVPPLLPRRRRGRKPSFGCVWRWATRGCRGVRLETIRVGATLCTSKAALQRFCEALTAQDNSVNSPSPPIRTSRQRERQIAAADEHLRREGVLE